MRFTPSPFATASLTKFPGVISTITLSAAGQLASSVGTAYTNNAAAAAATIANAPVAGNPTKWIPINDNGTIRNIPAW